MNEKPTAPVVKSPAAAPATHAAATHAPATKSGAPTTRTVDEVPPPVIAQLLPPSAAVGDPSFAIHVIGSGFDGNSVIVFAGNVEPTTQVSETELTTVMNMPLWLGADHLSVQVKNADGQESAVVMFELQPPRAVPLDPAEPSKPSPAVDLI